MATDLDSYHEHNGHYTSVSLEKVREAHKTLTVTKAQYIPGNPIGNVVDTIPERIKLVVDIGAGHGWGANFLAQHFDHVYGIEPSEAALNMGKEIYKGVDNITWIQGFAEEELSKLELDGPALFYCACVLSHLRHETVGSICGAINKVAKSGSMISLSENWGPMQEGRCWYSRTQQWWQAQFPGWELTFLDGNSARKRLNKGIIGTKK